MTRTEHENLVHRTKDVSYRTEVAALQAQFVAYSIRRLLDGGRFNNGGTVYWLQDRKTA